jgi:ABC-type transporter MlaC component
MNTARWTANVCGEIAILLPVMESVENGGVSFAYRSIPSEASACSLSVWMASSLQFFMAMKTKKTVCKVALLLFGALALSLTSSSGITRSEVRAQGPVVTELKLTPHEKQLFATFGRRVKDYLEQRKAVAKKLPKLSKEATPEEIEAYQKAFVARLQAMRAGTKAGYIFRPQFTEYVRNTIKTEFPPRDKAEIKQTILEAENKAVPLKINYPYPESQELTQIPPTLLLKLPTLPKEVKFRFVRRHLLLVDTDNGLIVDYTLNALP